METPSGRFNNIETGTNGIERAQTGLLEGESPACDEPGELSLEVTLRMPRRSRASV